MDHHQVVAFAVDANTVDFTAGDRVLAEAVSRRDGDVRPMVWGAPCDPSDLVMIRSTWDYAERPDAFRAWLAELAEFAARGVSVRRMPGSIWFRSRVSST